MNDGFLVHRTRSPLGLGLVVAAHAGVIAALALSVTHVIKPTEIFIPFKQIEEPPPPPPVRQHVEHPAPIHAVSTIDQPQPRIAIPNIPTGPAVQQGPVTIDLPPLDKGAIDMPIEIKTPPPMAATEASLDPRYASALQPAYPPALERAGTEGSCTVRVLIGADGRVREVQQVASDDPLFFVATRLQALRHWRFRAATRGGQPIEAWKTMTVRFHLDG